MEAPLQQILESRSAGIVLQSPSDWRAYRIRTTKQLARARRGLKLQQRSTKGSKVLKQKVITSEQVSQDPRYAEVILFAAERAWAHAMETKAELETNGSGAKRARVVSRLAKAAKLCKYLASQLAESSALSQQARLEFHTYSSLVFGALAFEQHRWAGAIEHFSNARVALDELTKQAHSDSVRELLADVITTNVDPSLSFAVYRTGKVRSDDIPTFAKLSADKSAPTVELVQKINPKALSIESNTGPAARLGEIDWHGHKATVEDPDLASALIQAREIDSKLDRTLAGANLKKRSALFDGVLQAWQDALDLVKEGIDRLESSSKTDETTRQQQYIVQTYTHYKLLLRRIQRDRLLMEQLSVSGKSGSVAAAVLRYRDVARICDTIIQSVSQILELPGVHNNEQLSSSFTTLGNYFRAQRTALIAKYHRLADNKRESLALFRLAKSTLESTPASSTDLVSAEEIAAFDAELTTELVRSHGMAAADTGNVRSPSAPSVAQQPGLYPSGSPAEILANLVHTNPRLQLAPIKPVFFDTAYNFIQYDDARKQAVLGKAEPQTTQRTPSTAETEKKGFLGSLWGRK